MTDGQGVMLVIGGGVMSCLIYLWRLMELHRRNMVRASVQPVDAVAESPAQQFLARATGYPAGTVLLSADDRVRAALATVAEAEREARDVEATDIAGALPQVLSLSSDPWPGGFFISGSGGGGAGTVNGGAGGNGGVVFNDDLWRRLTPPDRSVRGGPPAPAAPDLPPLRGPRTILPHPEDK